MVKTNSSVWITGQTIEKYLCFVRYTATCRHMRGAMMKNVLIFADTPPYVISIRTSMKI